MSIPYPPCPTPFNMAQHVLRHAQITPDKCALKIIGADEGGDAASSWSYAALDEAIRSTATGLLRCGLQPADSLLMRLGNRVEFPVLYLAAILVGIIPVPTSAQLTTAEISKIYNRLRPAAVIAQDGIALPDQMSCPVHDVSCVASFKGLARAEPVLGDPNRHAYTIFTSGTSGNPQAVRHAHRAIWARGMMHDDWYAMSATDRVLHAGAFNWTYTLGTGLMDPWSLGATALVPAPGTPAAALAGLVAAHDATILAAAPGVFRQMLKAPPCKMASLRHGLSAGEKLSDTTRARWRQATGCDLHEALGMSECSTFISGSPARPAPPGASGFAQTGRVIAALDGDGTPVAAGRAGVLAISTADPGLMLGYLGTPDISATGDTWFVTGDMVTIGADGVVHYLARADDMMTAGGFRIAPSEVETAFGDIDAIEEAAVTQVQLTSETTVIALFYVSRTPLDEHKLRAHAQVKLARYKQPRLYISCDSLPKGPNGKLNRRILAAQYQRPR